MPVSGLAENSILIGAGV